jgi:CBS domain-containing protein
MSCCSDAMKPIEASSYCTPQDTAAHAARTIRDSGCGCAPVVEDTENLKLVGVVTERDVCCGVAADDRRASDVRVEEIMRPSTACCGADESLEEARRKLYEHRATSLPVVDSRGGCCGTVSVHQLEHPTTPA